MNISASQLEDAAVEASELLKAMANRHRLLILCKLVEGERSVGELADLVAVRDSTVSQHLAILRRDGLVDARRDGQTIWYSISSQPALSVVESLYWSFCRPEAPASVVRGKRRRRLRS